MKWIFIVNIKSGQGKSLKELSTIHKVMRKHHQDYEIIKTEEVLHATKLANKYNKNDNVCLVSMGGDGTLNEVVNGINEGVNLAVIPSGTGNDFFRLIADQNKSIEELITDLISYQSIKVDYCQIKYNHHTSYFINSASFGLDVDVYVDAIKLIKNKFLTKSMAYNLAISKNIFFPKKNRITYTVDDGQPIEINTMIFAIMNGRYYGNGFKPTADALIDDGLLDLCIIKPLTLSKITKLLPKYKKGTLTSKEKEVINLKAQKIKIHSLKTITAERDGELFNFNDLEITVIKKGINLLIPHNSFLSK